MRKQLILQHLPAPSPSLPGLDALQGSLLLLLVFTSYGCCHSPAATSPQPLIGTCSYSCSLGANRDPNPTRPSQPHVAVSVPSCPITAT